MVQVRLGTEVLCTPSLTRPGFELMIHTKETSNTWADIFNSCRKCAEFSPEKMRPYARDFQYQGCKLWSLLNSMGCQTINIHIYFFHLGYFAFRSLCSTHKSTRFMCACHLAWKTTKYCFSVLNTLMFLEDIYIKSLLHDS